jgi:hypothetical protein
MAKSFGAEIETQVKSARNRMEFGRIDGVEHLEASKRLAQLDRSLQAIGPTGDQELYRHFPVATIAVLEGHFKTTVATIINEGSPYLERGLALAKDRLKSATDVVPLLHRKAVTIGDVIAHVIPFNSVSSLENAFCALLDVDFKMMIAGARNPYDMRNECVTPCVLVPSVADLWCALSLAFERRHILAHEAATKFLISFEDAKAAVDSCTLFASALDAVMWSTIWRDEPLTQYEMNVAAWSRCKEVRVNLAADLWKALAVATENGERVRFRRMHSAWKSFSKQWMDWEGEPFAMGSIRPMLAAISQERALAARREAIQGWLSLMRPEDRSA